MFSKKRQGSASANFAGRNHPFIKNIKKTGLLDKPKLMLQEILEHLKANRFEYSKN